MHTLRLLDQAIEIARDHWITFPRADADWLKRVKAGIFEYEELLKIADEKYLEMESAFEASSLPEQPSPEVVGDLLLDLREAFSR